MSVAEWPYECCPLTPAELRALELLMQALGRKTSTVRSQLNSAYRRLGVRTSYQAVLQCVRAGWLAWSDDDPEIAVLIRIEALLRELVAAIDARDELTVAQRDYLDCLDEYLRARDHPGRGRSRAQMDQALRAMMRDARVTVIPLHRPVALVPDRDLEAEAAAVVTKLTTATEPDADPLCA